MIKSHLCVTDASLNVDLTLEGVRGGGGGINLTPPPPNFFGFKFLFLD